MTGALPVRLPRGQAHTLPPSPGYAVRRGPPAAWNPTSSSPTGRWKSGPQDSDGNDSLPSWEPRHPHRLQLAPLQVCWCSPWSEPMGSQNWAPRIKVSPCFNSHSSPQSRHFPNFEFELHNSPLSVCYTIYRLVSDLVEPPYFKFKTSAFHGLPQSFHSPLS